MAPVAASSFWVHAAQSIAGGLLSRLIMLMGLALCAKYLYSEGEIGSWGALFGITLYLVPLGTLRYEVAVQLPAETRIAQHLVLGSLITSSIAVVIIALLASLLAWQDLLGSIPPSLIFLVPVLMFSQCLRQLALAWISRRRQFGRYAFAEVLQSLLVVGLLAISGLSFPGHSHSFVLASALGYVLAAIVTGWLAFPLPGASHGGTPGPGWAEGDVAMPTRPLARARIAWSEAGSALRRYAVYPRFLVPYSLSGGLVQHLQVAVLAFYYGLDVAGAFALAHRFVYAPASLLVAPLRQVFYVHGTVVGGRLDDRTLSRMRRLLCTLVAIVPVAAFGVGAFGIGVLEAWLGPAYARTSECMRVLLAVGAVNVLTGWIDRIYDLLGRQRMSVMLQVSADTVIFGTVMGMVLHGFDASSTIATFAALMLSYELIWLAISLRVAGQTRRFICCIFAALLGISTPLAAIALHLGGRPPT